MEQEKSNNEILLMERFDKMEKKINKIHRYIVWLRIISFFKLLIIVIPIALGVIYLPAFWRQMKPSVERIFGAYQNLYTPFLAPENFNPQKSAELLLQNMQKDQNSAPAVKNK